MPAAPKSPTAIRWSLPGLTRAPLLLCELARHLEMLLEGRQVLASKGFDIGVSPLIGFCSEELHGFLMIRDHVTHVVAVKTRPALLAEGLCSLPMLLIYVLGDGDV